MTDTQDKFVKAADVRAFLKIHLRCRKPGAGLGAAFAKRHACTRLGEKTVVVKSFKKERRGKVVVDRKVPDFIQGLEHETMLA